MKALITCLLVISSALQGFVEKIQQNRISFDYSYTVQSGTPVLYKGSVLMQQDCFYAVGNGLRIFCDGKTRWTVDEKAKEVYMEDASDVKDILSNISDYLENAYDLEFGEDSFKGAYVDAKTGVEANFVIKEILVFPKKEDIDVFIFDPSKLEKDWIITDLR